MNYDAPPGYVCPFCGGDHVGAFCEKNPRTDGDDDAGELWAEELREAVEEREDG
jgi:hypothetical protein